MCKQGDSSAILNDARALKTLKAKSHWFLTIFFNMALVRLQAYFEMRFDWFRLYVWRKLVRQIQIILPLIRNVT